MAMARTSSRRNFLRTAGAAIGALATPYVFTADAEEATLPRSKNDRLRFGAIGLRYQGSVVTRHAVPHGDIVALCDVDQEILAKAREEFGSQADTYEDHRKLLDRKDIDAVIIGTPDHWHTPMVIDACRAGKDVYCEKPLTLTIDEGKQLVRVVEETKRVVQVGSWQRSDWRFRTAAELVHAGRIGKVKHVLVVLGKNVQGGPFAVKQSPATFNWDRWQGQTPDVPYIAERSHYTFRWWQAYSGGQMTDWGAHHVDIAQWIIGKQRTGPVKIEGTAVYPQVTDGYDVARDYGAKYVFEDGIVLDLHDHGRNGILVTGEKGRIFVNRENLEGVAVEELKTNPLPREKFALYDFDNQDRPLRAGKHDAIINHMGNFVDCIKARKRPLSDIECQHRSVSTCHLGNLAMKLGRPLTWDPQSEFFLGDDAANSLLKRPQRAGYEFSA